MPPFLHNDCLSEWPLTVTFPHMARLLSPAVRLPNACKPTQSSLTHRVGAKSPFTQTGEREREILSSLAK